VAHFTTATYGMTGFGYAVFAFYGRARVRASTAHNPSTREGG
jgi:hypothetical protein